MPAGSIIFGLDALQVRQRVAAGAWQLAFRVASTTAVTKSILGILTLGAFGLASFKARRRRAARKAQRGGLIIGGSGTAAPGLRPSVPAARASSADGDRRRSAPGEDALDFGPRSKTRRQG